MTTRLTRPKRCRLVFDLVASSPRKARTDEARLGQMTDQRAVGRKEVER